MVAVVVVLVLVLVLVLVVALISVVVLLFVVVLVALSLEWVQRPKTYWVEMDHISSMWLKVSAALKKYDLSRFLVLEPFL